MGEENPFPKNCTSMDWPMPSHDLAQRRTPLPEEEDAELYMDDSTAPGADEASDLSPGSASDHMGYVLKDVSSANLQPIVPGSAAISSYDRQQMNLEGSKQDIDKSSSGSLGGGGAGETMIMMDGEKDDGKRRQKRLERNRESARVSRKRRKQYLEDLEKNVNRKAEEVDEARRRHIGMALAVIQQKRSEVIIRGEPESIPLLDAHLSRTSVELMLMTTFHSQQIKSFSQPPLMKMVLWLSLQPEVFFRGGRAASERLSAARIGERILTGGTTKANPSRSMWPLFCNEISLSYEQEEKVRVFQRKLLQEHDSWLDRHTAFASKVVTQKLHDATQAITLRTGQREKATAGILSNEQRMKLLSFTARNRDRIRASKPKGPTEADYVRPISKDNNHIAVNLYILGERLNGVLNRIPQVAPLVTGSRLKKLTRRACFESLSSCDEKGMQATSSCGSMKRSASEMSMDENDPNKQTTPAIIPTQSEKEAMPAVDKALALVRDLLPPRPVVVQPPVATHNPLPAIPSPIPMPTLSYQAPISQSAPQISSLVRDHDEFPPRAVSQHERKSSFLPDHLNVVPEEMWPEGDESADDLLLAMLDGEWAVGEGIDMDM